MNIMIREAVVDDLFWGLLPALSALSPCDLTPQEAVFAFRDRADSGILTYVAIDTETNNNVVVGTASLFIERKFIHRCGRVGHIEDVAVNPEIQSHGVGASLVDFLVEESRLRGCYKVILDCNEKLVKFYEKRGFLRAGNQMRIDL